MSEAVSTSPNGLDSSVGGVIKQGRGRPRKPESAKKNPWVPKLDENGQPRKRGRPSTSGGGVRTQKTPRLDENGEPRKRGRPPKPGSALTKSTPKLDENGQPRKRGRPPKDPMSRSVSRTPSATPGKGKRGRPPKDPISGPVSRTPSASPQKRGRPPKSTSSEQIGIKKATLKVIIPYLSKRNQETDSQEETFNESSVSEGEQTRLPSASPTKSAAAAVVVVKKARGRPPNPNKSSSEKPNKSPSGRGRGRPPNPNKTPKVISTPTGEPRKRGRPSSGIPKTPKSNGTGKRGRPPKYASPAKSTLDFLNGSRNSSIFDNDSVQEEEESPVKSEPFEGEMSSATDEEHEVYHANKQTPPSKSPKIISSRVIVSCKGPNPSTRKWKKISKYAEESD